MLGNSDVAITTLGVLSFICIATREEGYLSEILLLGLMVLSVEERIGTRVNKGTPILQGQRLRLVVSLLLTNIYQV